MLDEIKTFLGKDWKDTDARIRTSLGSDIDLLNKTNAAILSNNGKQLRPMVSLLVARACSGGRCTEDSIRFAAASELLHNATLLHDDVVDGSDKRRGMPTVMSLLGGPASVLIGDFWLVKAIKCILASPTHSEEVTRIFAKTLSDLAEGEMLQLQKASACDTTREDYIRIIYSKTASLFEASVLSGALSADAPEEWTAALAGYARNLGIAFQIQDDILDYAGGEDLGKPVGIDLREQKITLPLLCALDSVSEEAASAVRAKVGRISDEPELAADVQRFVREHDGVDKARAEMGNYIDEAVFCLEELPQTEEKSYLANLARFVGDRTF